jgi:hypothetical protein
MSRVGSRRFAVALSFPGERREYVERVARALLPSFGGEIEGKSKILYDLWHEASIIGYAATRRLQGAYSDSDLIVPFYCADYRTKQWCGVELRVIEQFLFDQEFDRVLPFRFDAVEIPGSFKTDIFPLISDRKPEEIASLIVERYNDLQRSTSQVPTARPMEPRKRHFLSARALLIGCVGAAGLTAGSFVWRAQSTADPSRYVTPPARATDPVQSDSPVARETRALEVSELRGSLRDGSGRPVRNATLTIEGGIARGQSNELGEFGFQVPRAPGTQVRLTIWSNGRMRFDDYVTLPGPMTLTLP